MSKEAWTKFNYNNDRQPEFGLPAAYHLPFTWGGLQISEQAHESYGMVPLNADVVNGPIDFHARPRIPKPEVDIVLLAPGELDISGGRTGGIGMDYKLQLHDRGIDLAAAFDKTADEFSEFFLEQSRQQGLDPEYLHDIHGVPATESAAHHAPQVLAESFSQGLIHPLSRAHAGYMNMHDNHSAATRLRFTTLAGGIVAGVYTVPEFVSAGEVGSSNAIAALVSLVLYGGLGSSVAYRHIKHSERRQAINDVVSGHRAAVIAQDIHTSFSREYFEKRLLGPEAE